MKIQTIFGMLTLSILSVSVHAAQIHLDRSVPSAQKNLLLRDFSRLDTLEIESQNQALKNLLRTPDTSNASLTQWLEDRVQSVVGENFDFQANVFTARSSYQYENSDSFPTIEHSNVVPTGPSVIIMSNMGAALYLRGKSRGSLLGVKLDGGARELPISSPRSGLIQVGPGLFAGRQISPAQPDSIANTLSRLTTFFHEARHSDGRKNSAIFAHAVCPEGHRLAGYHACDRNLNGPYTVGALLLKTMTENCSQCTVAERETLRVLYTENFGRIIGVSSGGVRSTRWDPRPEGRRL